MVFGVKLRKIPVSGGSKTLGSSLLEKGSSDSLFILGRDMPNIFEKSLTGRR